MEEQRERTTEALAEHYARDRIDLEEFERLVEQAAQAKTAEELDAVLATVEPPAAQEPAGCTALVPLAEVPERRSMVSVFGQTTRRNDWVVPRKLRVVSVLSGADLDFREAKLGPGVTEIQVVSVLAGVHLIVPPELPVEMDGTGILGNFEDKCGPRPTEADPGCRLRITGAAVLSGVEVEDRLPGESKRKARKRRKKAKQALELARKDKLLSERNPR